MVREPRFELGTLTWQARVLPLYHTRRVPVTTSGNGFMPALLTGSWSHRFLQKSVWLGVKDSNLDSLRQKEDSYR